MSNHNPAAVDLRELADGELSEHDLRLTRRIWIDAQHIGFDTTVLAE